MLQLQVKQVFKDLIPALTPEEYSQLESNVLAEGIREKLITWRGVIIDGHNRYELAQKHGLEYQCTEYEFESESKATEWIILNQFGRRNLSNYQRSLLALKLEGVAETIAKNKEKERREKISHYRETGETVQISAPSKKTREEFSKLAGVSHDTISKVKKIEAVAAPEVRAKVASGDMSINEAYKEIRAEEKKAERIEAIQAQIQDIESGKMPELRGLYSVVSVDPPWPYEGNKGGVTSYDANGRRVANPYPEMSIEEIKCIELPLLPDAVVFLWTTHKFLPCAFGILEQWGLEYKATLVWNKESIGMGAWLRMQCEFCLVGIKGNPLWHNTTHRDIITEKRREHSRKPDGFFVMVEQITGGRRLEYFSREMRENWDVFGNDTEKF